MIIFVTPLPLKSSESSISLAGNEEVTNDLVGNDDDVGNDKDRM